MPGYTVTIPEDLYKNITRIADQEGRSKHKQILKLLEIGVLTYLKQNNLDDIKGGQQVVEAE